MRLIFVFKDGPAKWRDVWTLDRWGNVEGRLQSPGSMPHEFYHHSSGTEPMIRGMAYQYFRAVINPSPDFVADIQWTTPACPWEVAGFIQLQEEFRLLHPEYRPNPAHQPRFH